MKRKLRILICFFILLSSFFIIPTLENAYAIEPALRKVKIEELSSGILLNDAYPTKDEIGKNQTGYKIKIKTNNKTSINLSFENTLEANLPRLENHNLRYIILKNNEIYQEPQELNHTGFLFEDTILEDTIYEIRMWIKEDAKLDAMGKYFSGKIVIF